MALSSAQQVEFDKNVAYMDRIEKVLLEKTPDIKGKWVIVSKQKFQASKSTFAEAIEFAYDKCGIADPFVIRQIGVVPTLSKLVKE